jgi:putative transposase
MPRIARIVIPNYPHHITQRGNNKRNIFSEDRDKEKYLSYIDGYSDKYNLSILSYCLMDNHVHFVAIPGNENSLSKTYGQAHHRYSYYYNKKINASGHLRQGRFYSCLLDKRHLISAIRYVERNLVRAGLVRKAWEWRWSSARARTGGEDTQIKLRDIRELIEIDQFEWEGYLDTEESEGELNAIRRSTMQGRLYRGNESMDIIGKKVGISLRAFARGRPKKYDN